jgi:hypothetical protein
MNITHLTIFSFCCHNQRRNADQVIENAADITNWNKRNTKAMQTIFGAIKEEQSRILMSCSTAQEMWMKLETEYEEAAADNAPLLWTKFYGCTFRPSSDYQQPKEIFIFVILIHILS